MPMAAGALLVLSIAGFAALDFHTSSMHRTHLQDSLDSVTLAVARSDAVTNAELDRLGEAMLKDALHKSSGKSTLSDVKFKEDDGVIHGKASITFTPLMSGFFTGKQIKIAATSQVAPGDSLEVALVLDNTYSMAGTRIATLKTAATNFVNILEKTAAMSRDDDALKISLVPFSTTVNVGSGYSGAAWMDTQGLSPIHHEPFNAPALGARPTRFTLFSRLNTSWAGCVESRPAPYDVQDTAPSAGTPATLFVPYFAPDEYDAWDPYYTENRWWNNNYVPDDMGGTDWLARQKRVEKYDQAPASKAYIGSGYYRGPNYECTLRPLVRLTTDGEKVKRAIAELTVAGDTNIPVGLAWGWHTLSPKAPFKDGVAYGTPKTKKIAVLMTDGQNTIFNNNRGNQSIYSAIGYIAQNRVGITGGTDAERRAAVDARLALLCKNMKAQGIIIYTMRLEVDDTNYKVLQDCATTPEMFRDVKQASELDKAFKQIAADIQKLRIAR